MKQLTKAKFEEKVTSVFSSRASGFNETNTSFEFQVDSYTLDYEKLVELSKILETTKISMRPIEEFGGCPTCGGGLVTFITIDKG